MSGLGERRRRRLLKFHFSVIKTPPRFEAGAQGLMEMDSFGWTDSTIKLQWLISPSEFYPKPSCRGEVVVDFLVINSSSSSPFEFPTYPIDHFPNYITCGPLNSICQDVRILNGDKNPITQASSGGFSPTTTIRYAQQAH
jgi:hypothetical protein